MCTAFSFATPGLGGILLEFLTHGLEAVKKLNHEK